MAPDELIARHHAPTLAGLKCSSLSCLGRKAFSAPELIGMLRIRGLGFRFFHNAQGCTLLFSYRPLMLEKALSPRDVEERLAALGYPLGDLEAMLDHLGSRLEQDDFPHEIGFFLGYPKDDVIAFLEHGGRGYLYSGMWKMYHRVEEGKATCEKYRRCTLSFLKALECGARLDELCPAI